LFLGCRYGCSGVAGRRNLNMTNLPIVKDELFFFPMIFQIEFLPSSLNVSTVMFFLNQTILYRLFGLPLSCNHSK
jgi:hypothetical protein